MENLGTYLNIIIILLIILILLCIIFVAGLGLIYLRKKSSSEAMSTREPIKTNKGYYCTNHPDAHSVGTCMICNKSFCDKCLADQDRLNFCSEHLKLYLSCEWQQIETIKTDPNKPEDALILYEFKDSIWCQNDIPSYIVTHYKINFENDFIESFVTLYVKKQDGYEITKRLATFKKSFVPTT